MPTLPAYGRCYVTIFGATECIGGMVNRPEGIMRGNDYGANQEVAPALGGSGVGETLNLTPHVVALSDNYYVVCYPQDSSGTPTVGCKMLEMECGGAPAGCTGNRDINPQIAQTGTAWNMGGTCPAYAMTMTRISTFNVEDDTNSVLLCISSEGSTACPALKCAVNSALDPATGGISFPDYATSWTVRASLFGYTDYKCCI